LLKNIPISSSAHGFYGAAPAPLALFLLLLPRTPIDSNFLGGGRGDEIPTQLFRGGGGGEGLRLAFR
jgi:hypothetical protein